MTRKSLIRRKTKQATNQLINRSFVYQQWNNVNPLLNMEFVVMISK